jgi:hypothetical protein
MRHEHRDERAHTHDATVRSLRAKPTEEMLGIAREQRTRQALVDLIVPLDGLVERLGNKQPMTST